MNTQINEDYCDFETAKLLKEKGFECATLHYYYDKDGDLLFSAWRIDAGKNEFVAPTIQMAMKWLREDKKRIINAWFDGYNYQSEVCKPEDEIFTLIGDEFKTYEEACEAAIKYCLTNLI